MNKTIIILLLLFFSISLFAQNETTIKYFRDIDLQKEKIEKKANYKLVSSNNGEKTLKELFEISTGKLLWKKNYRNNKLYGTCYYMNENYLKPDSVIYGRFKPKGFYTYDLKNQKMMESVKGDFTKPKLIGTNEDINLITKKYNCSDITAWIVINVNYPEEAQVEGIEGDVQCQFTIDEKGEVGNVRITGGVNRILDIESFRLLKSIAKMQPAELNGKPIKLYIETPINFLLQ